MFTFFTIFTIAIMLAVAYAFLREGIFTALCTFVNMLLAGLITFNFWEPLADLLDAPLRDTVLRGFEDILVMIPLFALILGLLRMLMNTLVPEVIEYPALLQQVGGSAVGLLLGYLLSGFLVCAFQTLPWHENFMGFEPRAQSEGTWRSWVPADRAWLSLMRYAGASPLANKEVSSPPSDSPYDAHQTFDRNGTFELRYLRYRRYGDKRERLPYQGELDRELDRPR